MFKFLKEALADAPPVNPSPRLGAPTGPAGIGLATSDRARSVSGPASAPSSARVEPTPVKKLEDEATKDDLVVRDLVDKLKAQTEADLDLSEICETLSNLRIELAKHVPAAQALFRVQKGFETIRDVLKQLKREEAPPPMSPGNGKAKEDVEESMRHDAVKACLAALDAGLLSDLNRRYFEHSIGWPSLIPVFRSISGSRLSNRFLGILLSFAFNGDDSLVELMSSLPEPPGQSATDEKDPKMPTWPAPLKISPNLCLTHPTMLPVIFAFLPWPFPQASLSLQGDKPESAYARFLTDIMPHQAKRNPEHDEAMVEAVWRVMIVALQSSLVNLFQVSQHLEGLVGVLLDSLYPPERKAPQRSVVVSGTASGVSTPRHMRARPSIFVQTASEESIRGRSPMRNGQPSIMSGDMLAEALRASQARPGQAPELPVTRKVPERLRPTLLKVLRRLLEAGVPYGYSHRLFRLARKITPPPEEAPTDARSPSPANGSGSQRRRPAKLNLRIDTLNGDSPPSESSLDLDILEVIKHAMSKRWPDMFCFSSRMSRAAPTNPAVVNESKGGRLHCADLGKAWPPVNKGFSYSAWIYVEHLCGPITLLHLCEKDRTLFRIRLLPNSQIGVLGSTSVEEDGKEQIFQSADALVPHQQWVHFAVSERKSRNPAAKDATEVKLLLNGRRVGIMKCAYPRPTANANIAVFLGKDGRRVREQDGLTFDDLEGSEWFLGPSWMFADYIGDDLGMLLHHLGPRYTGNMQEALGKFLTYEGATALNIFLSALAKEVGKDPSRPVIPTNSYLVKAIKEGRVFSEDTIIFAYSATNSRSSAHVPGNKAVNVWPSQLCLNAAIAQPNRALESSSGKAKVEGDVFPVTPTCADIAIGLVGGPAVALKLVQLAKTSAELGLTLGILFESIRENWQASEDMERMRGYDILAGLLKSKMNTMVTASIAKTTLAFLGMHPDKPDSATVLNSTGYRAMVLHLDLWASATPEVFEVFLQHFHALLRTSKYRRFNILRCFKKAGLVRKLVFTLKSNVLSTEAAYLLIDVLHTACSQHWSTDDTIKPLFAYLISSLCPSTPPPSYMNLLPTPATPPSSQVMPSAALSFLPEVLSSPTHLAKLMSTLPLHRVLIIFLSSNPAIYVAMPCLQIVKLCLSSPNEDLFQRKFESEGGFVLLARVLASLWNEQIRLAVFECISGAESFDDTTTIRARMFPCLAAALERLLQTACDMNDTPITPRPPHHRSRSATTNSFASPGRLALSMTASMTASPASPVDSNGVTQASAEVDELSPLLAQLLDAYNGSAAFMKLFTAKRLEAMIPPLTDFISLSASPSVVTPKVMTQRKNVKAFIEALNEDQKIPTLIRSHLTALHDQLRMANVAPRPSSSGQAMSSSNLFSPSRMSASMFAPSSPLGGSSPSSMSRGPMDLQRKGSMGRPKSLIERRLPLRRQMTGENTLAETKDKNVAWKQSIITAEAKRFSKTTLDLKEYWRHIAQVDWPRQTAVVDADNGLWPIGDAKTHWRLDGSEGPMRMRMKLERVSNNPADKSAAFYPRSQRNAIPRQDELSSAVSRVNAPASEDPFALAMADAFGKPASSLGQVPENEEVAEAPRPDSDDEEILDDTQASDKDKHRRIAQTLQTGDSVDEAYNIARVVGVDAQPGLLIIGKRNLYLVDGLVQAASGEIINCQDAPRDVLTIPSGTLAELDAAEMQSHRWSYTSIVETSKRSFLFRDVALELFFSDKRNFLCVFRTKKERQNVLQRLANKTDPNAMNKSALGNFVLDTVSKALDKMAHELENVTKRWQQREISNFAYLQVLNTFANRTPNDVTSYPVMPWVIQDYQSLYLDLTHPASFRDLSLPMGALTAERRAAATERYQQMELAGEKPFQFGTHYSSSMIVCSYNIRLSPFTEMFLALQGGTFDLADRLFSSVPRAWASASNDNRGDVRELISEFFYNPLFLTNLNAHDFGKRQASDEIVNDVELPPWALGDPLLFIHRMREALESDYVSKHLPAWIDLIFGYKQHDVSSFTCYHPLSYAGAIDLDRMQDENEKAATVGIIHNFGQTPKQIFLEPHPSKFLFGKTTLPYDRKFGVEEHWPIMMRSIKPLAESSVDLASIFPANSTELPPVAFGRYRIPFARLHSSTLQYGLLDQSMRGVYGLVKVVCVAESTPVVEACFVSANHLATASPSGTISLWRVNLASPSYLSEGSKFVLETTLRCHELRINHLVASEAWSLLVSSSDDGTAVVWDMNRTRYLHTLRVEPKEAVLAAAVHEFNGHIALLCESHLHTYTLNGAHIASARIPISPTTGYTMGGPPKVTAVPKFCGGISFHNREFSRDGPLLAVGLDNNVCLWRLTPGSGDQSPWFLQELKRWPGPDYHGHVTAVRFIDEALCATFARPARFGPGTSALYQWSLPEGGARALADQSVAKCMAECGRSFGLLEGRHRCGGCGGIFCGQDALPLEGFNMRYCQNCRVVLALGMGVLGSRPGSRAGSRLSSRRGSAQGSVQGEVRSRRGSSAGPGLGLQ